MSRNWIFLSAALALFGGHAVAQQALVPRTFPPVQDDLAKHHIGPFAKPCLAIEGYVKPELINKNIYQHWIRVTNSCSQNVKVQICYYKTDDCVLVSVSPYERKEAILGIFPALRRFQFEAKEQF